MATLLDTLELLFDYPDETTYIYTKDGRIVVNQRVIRQKCPELYNCIYAYTIELKEYSDWPVRMLFKYMYCHKLDLSDWPMQHLLELYEIAKRFNIEDFNNGGLLSDFILHYMKEEASITNQFELLALSYKMEDQKIFETLLKDMRDRIFEFHRFYKTHHDIFNECMGLFMELPVEIRDRMFCHNMQNKLISKWVMGEIDKEEEKKEEEKEVVEEKKNEDDEEEDDEEDDENDIEEIKEKIEEVNEKFDNKIDDLTDKLEGLDETQDFLSERIDDVDESITEMDDKIDTLDDKINKITKKVKKLRPNMEIQELQKRIQELESRFESLVKDTKEYEII